MSHTNTKLNERRRAILSILSREGSVRVAQLSKQLGASEVTIRTDLELMEKEGLLERVHGGAVSTQSAFLSFPQSQTSNADAKKRLAETTVSLMKDGDTLLMNDGSANHFTAMELAKNAENKNLKVLTNSIRVATELSEKSGIQCILLGGIVANKQTFTHGSDSLNQLQGYRADKLILAVDGVDIRGGLTTNHAEDATLLQMMIQRSRQIIVVADYSQIGYESFFRVCPISAMHTLVTNPKANPDILDEIRALGINIIKTQ